MYLKEKILRMAYRCFPFSVEGDLRKFDGGNDKKLSVLLATYEKRLDLLETTLTSLLFQDYSWDDTEIIVVCDRGGSQSVKDLVNRFGKLPVKYFSFESGGSLGRIRNYCFAQSSGEFLLFIDDDTIFVEQFFLARLSGALEDLEEKTGIIFFRACPSYCDLATRSSRMIKYSPATRCVLFTREAVRRIKGFIENIITFEDIDIYYRILLSGFERINSKLEYYHPPDTFKTKDKALSGGASIGMLRRKYSFGVWLPIVINEISMLISGIVFFDKNKIRRQFFTLKGILLSEIYIKKIKYE